MAKENKRILIKFYWADDPSKHIESALAVIGEWDGKDDVEDSKIFFYFEDEAAVNRCKEEGSEDFVITSWCYESDQTHAS